MTDIPATAGQILTEERVRGFLKCTEFYNFGGEVKHSLETEVLRHTVEKTTAMYLRNGKKAAMIAKPKAASEFLFKVNRREHLLPQKLELLHQRSAWLLHNFEEIFSLDTYLPVYAATEYKLIVSKTPIKMRLSGVYRTEKNNALHIVDFSPYIHEHDVLNDPFVHLKLKMLNESVAWNRQRHTVKLHSFSVLKGSNTLNYTSMTTKDISQTQIDRATGVIKLMESGYHFPLLPCNINCPYKTRCKP
jgi:hypothetical protein